MLLLSVLAQDLHSCGVFTCSRLESRGLGIHVARGIQEGVSSSLPPSLSLSLSLSLSHSLSCQPGEAFTGAFAYSLPGAHDLVVLAATWHSRLEGARSGQQLGTSQTTWMTG